MFDDLEITITLAELTAGDNVTIRYGNATETGAFSLAAVADHVTRLNATLNLVQPTLEILKSAGSALFDALLGGDLLRTYAQATAPGRRVRLRLNSKLPDLIAIPWEYLYDRKREHWLALQPDLSLVRNLPVPGRKPVAVEGMLRVLVMISDPSDLPPLDTAAEWANLEAVADVAAIDLIRVEPTYAALLGALRQQPHVFHFIGHGAFDTATQQGLLYLQGDDGSADPVPAERLTRVLTGCESLRLALLNACQGATAGNRSAFAGVAQKLIQQGLPAVIAMQTPILDTDALVFSQEFYRALADGYNLEAALGEGRKRIDDCSSAWGVPALYCQGGEPFVITKLDDAQKAARLWQRVERLTNLPGSFQASRKITNQPGRWQGLVAQILTLNPAHTGAVKLQTQWDATAQAAALYNEAVQLSEQEQWRAAHHQLKEVERLAPNYRDTPARLMELYGKLYPFPLPPPSSDQLQPLLNALKEGRLIPFLGWDACRFGRLPKVGWLKGQALPDARELVHELAAALGEQGKDVASLAQISQYTALVEGEEALYERLHQLYAENYPPTLLHRLVAELPGRLRIHGYPTDANRRFVVFSAAFDDLLERAFAEAGQPYHLFAYRPRYRDADGALRPERFVHLAPADASGEREPVEITSPNTYTEHDRDPDRHPIIVKLCGQRVTPQPGSVVITEDHFLDYLPAQELGDLLPSTLLAQINRRSFALVGYDVQPWQFRLVWQRMKHQKRRLAGKSWAIVPHPNDMAQRFWRSQEIEPLDAAPELLVARVNEWLDML